MTSWRQWAVIPGLVAIAAIATGLSAYQGAQGSVAARDTALVTDAPHGPWGYSAASSDQNESPEQPIHFPHTVHVQKVQMNCLYCHYSANKSPDPGLPAVGTCMGCHTVVATQKPEIKKLAQYWNDKKPIPWVRIHKVPDYVNFPHMRHVSAGVTCQTCHGQIQKMTQVFQYSSLNMGWCVGCHVNGYDPARGDVAAGYTKTATGFSLVHDGQAPATAPADSTHNAVKKARYDCAICHY